MAIEHRFASENYVENKTTQLQKTIETGFIHAVNNALAQAQASGDFNGTDGKNGLNGKDGADGYTPQKGVDYWTESDKTEITDYIDNEFIDINAKAIQQSPAYPEQGETISEQLAWLAQNGDTSKLYLLSDGFLYGYTKTLVEGGAGYTNLVPTSIDTDGSVYNGVGYKDGVRLSSSGGVSSSAQTGTVTTGFMAWTPPKAVHMKGATFPSENGKHYYLNFYNSSKTFLYAINAQGAANGDFYGLSHTYDESTGVTTFDFSNGTGDWWNNASKASLIRIAAKGSGANLIVTAGEEIKEATATEKYQWTNTGRAFIPADYEDSIVELRNVTTKHTEDVNGLKEQVNDIVSGNTDVAASIKFDATVYDLPVLDLVGDISAIAVSKDNKVTLSYTYGGRTGTCTLKGQGATSYKIAQSLGDRGKYNYTINFDTAFEASEGWGVQKKYCLKANWIDHSHSRNIVSAKLWGKLVKSRAIENTNLSGLVNGGAIDGFPIVIILNGEFHGLYTFNIPKDGWMFGMVEDATKTQALVGANDHLPATQFKGESVGNDGDYELEFVSDEDNASWVTPSLNRLINACINSDGTDLDTTVAQYLDWDSAIDYYIHVVVLRGSDMVDKNFILVTFDGVKWSFTAYDMDSTYGLEWDGSKLNRPVTNINFVSCADTNRVFELIKLYKKNALKARYKELRQDILSESRICQTFENFAWAVPSPVALEDVKKYPSIQGSFVNGIDQICRWVRMRLETCDKWIDEL